MMRSLAASNSRQKLALCVATLALLLPFAGKAFHIDDPIFLWTAEQIHVDPGDFFGFEVNWYGHRQPMSEVNKNPPLVSFYLAAVAAIGGWGEIPLHLGMLLPTLALILGLYRLGGFFTPHPWLPAMLALTMPVLLVSATTLMSDVPMLALWVWAAVVFLHALERPSVARFALAGLLMGLCVLSKYFGLAVIPLLTAYALLRERKLGLWVMSVAIALAIVFAFDLYMRSLYGIGPLLDVARYATDTGLHTSEPRLQRGVVGLIFLGGGTLGGLLFAPFIWSARALAIGAPIVLVAAAGLVWLLPPMPDTPGLWIQHALFAVAGLHAFALAGADSWRKRDPQAAMLALWLLGVFCFAAFTNWTTNGRAVLPAVPAIALLIARALPPSEAGVPRGVLVAMLACLAITLDVTIGDYQLAGAGRQAAAKLASQPVRPDQTLFYQGGWGFQRYMEKAGVEKIAFNHSIMKPGDVILMPGNNTNVFDPPKGSFVIERVEAFPVSPRVALMSFKQKAGFYASLWGSLPFSYGHPEPELYAVFRMQRSWQPQRRVRQGP